MRLTFSTLALSATILVIAPALRTLAAGEVGQIAPALVAQELDGHIFDLAAQRGKVVVINFWATWCPPCRNEMPAFATFYRQYHARGVEMIGLSVDRPHDRSDVLKAMQSFNYPAAMLDDAKINDFGTPSALPVTFVIDGSGIVRAKLTPGEKPVTEKSLGDAVLRLLPGIPGAQTSPVQGSTASP